MARRKQCSHTSLDIHGTEDNEVYKRKNMNIEAQEFKVQRTCNCEILYTKLNVFQA
jgi:hypothetical protein